MRYCCVETIRKNFVLFSFYLFYFRYSLLKVCQPCNCFIEKKVLINYAAFTYYVITERGWVSKMLMHDYGGWEGGWPYDISN